MRKTRAARSERSTTDCSGEKEFLISGHFGLQVIVRNVFGEPTLMEISRMSDIKCILSRVSVLPTFEEEELNKIQDRTLPTSFFEVSESVSSSHNKE